MKLNELISISPGFHRSVHIKYDLNNIGKITGYIPTEKSEYVLENLLQSLNGYNNDRASMFIGSYGTGKSHLATFFGSLVSKEVNRDIFYPVLEKIKNPDVKVLLQKELDTPEPFLVIPISADPGVSINQILLNSLKKELSAKGLSIIIDTSYTYAQECINRWIKDYPETKKLLEKEIEESCYHSINDLSASLGSFNSDALHFFISIYPKLTAGAIFDYYNGSVADVYRKVCIELIKQGYRGLLLIFDEFNKIMDTSLKDTVTLKTLQDLAELASRSDETYQLSLLLVSHKTIGQYLTNENDSELTNEWRKIEGRFKIFDVSNKPWETYDIISRVLNKKDPDFYSIITNHNPVIKQIRKYNKLGLVFKGVAEDLIEKVVIEGCFPLHPLTVYILPRLSAKFAQNERTLFTFLTGQDESPINDKLSRDLHDLEYIMPYEVFDYFNSQIKASEDEDLRNLWKRISNAIEVLPPEFISEINLIKTIGVISALRNPINLPCTIDMLKYALGIDDISQLLKFLVDRKLVFIHQATNEVELIEPIETDIESLITEWVKDRPIKTFAISYLGELGLNHYILPHSYNHTYKITRYLTPVYASVDNIQSVISNGNLSPIYNGLDGVICYLFAENQSELKQLKQIVSNCFDDRILFSVPTKPFKINHVVWRYVALNEIIKNMDQTLDSRSRRMFDLYLADAKQCLVDNISRVTNPSQRVEYYWKGTMLHSISNEQELSNQVSIMMREIYKQTPIVNNELINKNNPTSTSKRARNVVIDQILIDGLGIREKLPSSQEIFMLDTLFINTDLFHEHEKDGMLVNKLTFGVESIIAIIEEYFQECKNNQKSFEPLIRILQSPPYGVRRGLIPVFLSACIYKYKQYITIRDSSGADCRIDAALLDNIAENKEGYFLSLDEWNEAYENLISGIVSLFDRQLSNNIFFANRFGDLADSLFKWYSGLPRVARETKLISENALNLRRYAKIACRNPKKAILIDLPSSLGYKNYTKKDVNAILESIRKCKSEIESTLSRLEIEINKKLHGFFSIFGNNSESLISLARNMVEHLASRINREIKIEPLISYIISFEGYDESKFSCGFAKLITGIRLEDWLDDTFNNFDKALNSLAESLSQSDINCPETNKVELLFINPYSELRKLTLYEIDISELGRILQSHIESAIENFGDAITELEKQQILLNLIKKYSDGVEYERNIS